LLACTLLLTPQAALAQTAPTTITAPRPILHFDVEIAGDQETIVLVAVDQNGAELMRQPIGAGGSWSPRGDWFAFLVGGPETPRGALRRANLAGESHWLFTALGDERLLPLGQTAWSPDGTEIALISATLSSSDGPEWALRIVDAVDGGSLARYPLPAETMAGWPAYLAGFDKIRWSPDGRAVLISWANAIVVDLASGQVEQVAASQVLADWSPAGDAVYYGAVPERGHPEGPQAWGGLFVRKRGAQQPVQVIDAPTLVAHGYVPAAFNFGLLTVSPSGKHLALVTGLAGAGEVLSIFDFTAEGALAVDAPPREVLTREVLTALEWAPDERSLAAIVGGPQVRVVVADLESGQWRTLDSLRWKPTGFDIDMLGLVKTLSWTR
jgi:Tol biopolymer transport system component